MYKNGTVGRALPHASRKENAVRREGDRVVISSGSGQSRVSWSFRPPEDAHGWTEDIRRVLSAADSAR